MFFLEVRKLKLEVLVARLQENSNGKTVYYYDANIDPDKLNKTQSGIVEIDECVFEDMEPAVVEKFGEYIVEQMMNKHIRIIQEATTKDFNQFGIDSLPFTIIREILYKYLIEHHIPDFAAYLYPDFIKKALQNEEIRKMFIDNDVISEDEINDFVNKETTKS